MSITPAQVMALRAATGAGMMDCKRALEETGGDAEQATDYLRKKGLAIAAKKATRETNEGGIAIAFAPDQRSAAIVRLACETDFVARNEQFRALLQGLAEQVLRQGDADVAAQKMASGQTVQEWITQAIATLGENLQIVETRRVTLSGPGIIGGYVHSNGRIGVLVTLGAEQATAAGQLAPLAKDLAMHVAASPVSAITSAEIDPALIAREKEIYAAQAKESGKPAAIIAKMVEGRLQKFVKEVALMHQPFVKEPTATIEQLLAAQAKALGVKLRVERFVKFQF
ncbi:MAG: elongation factor Ts [Candidatus Lambdaproteobacteria bacterium]|nr:elongation factor Ts [Candidatus Lambdaproteobacteria bacterium]